MARYTDDLIHAMQQQTEAISTFAIAVAQLSEAVAALVDASEDCQEQAEPQTYMDGTPV